MSMAKPFYLSILPSTNFMLMRCGHDLARDLLEVLESGSKSLKMSVTMVDRQKKFWLPKRRKW